MYGIPIVMEGTFSADRINNDVVLLQLQNADPLSELYFIMDQSSGYLWPLWFQTEVKFKLKCAVSQEELLWAVALI